MPPLFEPEWPPLFKEASEDEKTSLSKMPAREVVKTILDNKFEKQVLKDSSYMMVVKGLDLKNIRGSLETCCVVDCSKNGNVDPFALEGKTIISFEEWRWTIHFETGVLYVDEGSQEYNLICELLWSAL